jgi:hypothetical protein
MEVFKMTNPTKDGLWKFRTTYHYGYGSVPYVELKHKCPCCKKKTNFRRIDVNSDNGMVFCEGYYIPLYRCDKCMVILAIGEKT